VELSTVGLLVYDSEDERNNVSRHSMHPLHKQKTSY